MESQSFTYFSHNTMKEELVNLNENQLNALREFYVERFVDNMETEDLVQYVTDDMFQYMESLPDNEVIDECLNYGMIVLMMLLKKSRSLNNVISKKH